MIGSELAKQYLKSLCPDHEWKYHEDMDISSMCLNEQFKCSKCGYKIYVSRAARAVWPETTGFTNRIIEDLDIPPSCEAARMNWALE